ncbi:MAG: hypothetical protein F6K17_09005, partial [Okeania sp. SIO3C4]|nr:hypothetical protein [Okeania sp. SIO3C4]
MKYKQVIIYTLGLLVGMTQPVLGEFEIPTKSRPANRGDAGGRPGNAPPPKLCPQMEKPLLALVPQTNFG